MHNGALKFKIYATVAVRRALATQNNGNMTTTNFMGSNDVIKKKVVVIGEMAVGKTSLAVRYTKDSFMNHYQQTVGASFYVRSVEIGDKTVMFQIWDTAGQERFRSLVPMYLRDANVAIIMYDITSMYSFHSVGHWLQELIISAPSDVRITLVGNKCDLQKDRQVKYDVGKSYASQKNLAFIETSAKTGFNVDMLFLDLAREILAEKKIEDNGVWESIIVNDEAEVRQRKRRCCSS